MDSIQFHHIKLEKSRKVVSFVPLRAFASFFRLIELLLLLVLISNMFFRFPVAVKFSGDVFREAAVFLVSPRFVFVLGNAIVIILFAKSGRYSGQGSSDTTETAGVYQELVRKSENRSEIGRYKIEERGSVEEKRVRFDERICRRSLSEKSSEAVKPEKYGGKLKRYESDKCLRICGSDKKLVKFPYQEDVMSSEEFRNKIEAFIARQKRFQKHEEHFVI
ncbi:PREDICTED: uncharacterized protein LOC104819615 isoform X2 [Tarenaya hassleriana]|uniref:uncharacterized protein LOC104819615 isoform X1 n=1 Tax=Tarenaya hassleriana TaxID=28532 RepID=UPI00053C923B|nr:PREDICTED: uncharacterized protein LOC104819615 isoform X1 [Tarenaya hassleriana]XP_010548063.1 PREDICTED: uncharacterized protein LOC104819615 isoform X2 [Tarenaya hassleriana]